MVCPCRVNKEYDFKKVGDSIIIAGEREVYPDCYEDKCPCYIYPNQCANISTD